MTAIERARISVIVAARRWAIAQEQDARTRHLCDDWLLEANKRLVAAEQRAIKRARK